MDKCVIFDIDGTLVKTTHIIDEAKSFGLENVQIWDYFYKHCNDECIETIHSIVDMVNIYHNNGYQVFFVTGRNFANFEETNKLLMRIFNVDKEHQQWWQTMMRGKYDYRPASQVKKDALGLIMKEYKIDLLVDDEKDNIEMAKSLGICALLV